MKISIVTISYNQAKYLERCIQSVTSQNYVNYEHIIVDGGSTDGSIDIIEKYRGHFKEIFIGVDNGPIDALNIGFDYADGEVYYFLNSDDMLCENALLDVATIFETTRPDCLFGSGYIIDEKNSVVKQIIPTNFSKNEFIYNSAVIFQQGTFFTRDLYLKSKKFNPINNASWDGELFFDFKFLSEKFEVTHKTLGQFRVYSESGTGSGLNLEKWHMDRMRIFANFKGRSYKKTDHFLENFYKYFKYVRHIKRTLYLFLIISFNRTN